MPPQAAGECMRPPKARIVSCTPKCLLFCPAAGTAEGMNAEAVTLGLDMLEAMRLVDAEGLSQESAARSMNVSTSTLCRILGQGRRLAALALSSGKTITIRGGNVMCGNEMQGHGHGCCHGHGRKAMQTAGGACCGEGSGHGQGRQHGCHGKGAGHGCHGGSRGGRCAEHGNGAAVSGTDVPDAVER